MTDAMTDPDPIERRLAHYHKHRTAAEQHMTALGDAIMELFNAGHEAHLRYNIAANDHTRGELALVVSYVNEDQAARVIAGRARTEAETLEKIILQTVDDPLPALPPPGPLATETEPD